jgi:hypothetical protein
MAQLVGYYDRNVDLTEGPFVLVKPNSSHYRIEVECKDCPYTINVIHGSIITALGRRRMEHTDTYYREGLEASIDFLNRMVSEDKIQKNDKGQWVWVPRERP